MLILDLDHRTFCVPECLYVTSNPGATMMFSVYCNRHCRLLWHKLDLITANSDIHEGYRLQSRRVRIK